MSKFYADEDDLNWDYHSLDNASKGGVVVSELARVSLKDLNKFGITSYSELKIIRNFEFSPDELVYENNFGISQETSGFLDNKLDQLDFKLTKTDLETIREDILDAWNEKFPNDPLDDERLYIDEDKYGKEVLFIDGDKAIEHLSKELDDLDYDEADSFTVFFDGGVNIDTFGTFDKAMEYIKEEIFAR